VELGFLRDCCKLDVSLGSSTRRGGVPHVFYAQQACSRHTHRRPQHAPTAAAVCCASLRTAAFAVSSPACLLIAPLGPPRCPHRPSRCDQQPLQTAAAVGSMADDDDVPPGFTAPASGAVTAVLSRDSEADELAKSVAGVKVG